MEKSCAWLARMKRLLLSVNSAAPSTDQPKDSPSTRRQAACIARKPMARMAMFVSSPPRNGSAPASLNAA